MIERLLWFMVVGVQCYIQHIVVFLQQPCKPTEQVATNFTEYMHDIHTEAYKYQHDLVDLHLSIWMIGPHGNSDFLNVVLDGHCVAGCDEAW